MSGVRNQRYRNQIKDPILLFTKKPWTRHAASKSQFAHQQDKEDSTHISQTTGKHHFCRSKTIEYQQFHKPQRNSHTSGLKGGPDEVMAV